MGYTRPMSYVCTALYHSKWRNNPLVIPVYTKDQSPPYLCWRWLSVDIAKLGFLNLDLLYSFAYCANVFCYLVLGILEFSRIMEKKRVAVPLVCHGHSRPVVDLFYSPITPDGFFLISASKGMCAFLINVNFLCEGKNCEIWCVFASLFFVYELMALVDCFVDIGVKLLLDYIALLFIGYAIFIYDVQILAPCLEMERLEIGLEHLKDTRVQYGVAAWIRMLYVLHLAQRTSLRMHLKPILVIYLMHLHTLYYPGMTCWKIFS